MKKIKIMFCTLIAITIIGFIFSFKAKSPQKLYCSDTPSCNTSTLCPTFTDAYTYTDNPGKAISNVFCGPTNTCCDQRVTVED